MSELTDARIKPRTGDIAFLFVACPLKGECQFSVWKRPAADPMWHWNGDIERPSITPSIDCHGGCGRHFFVTEGAIR